MQYSVKVPCSVKEKVRAVSAGGTTKSVLFLGVFNTCTDKSCVACDFVSAI